MCTRTQDRQGTPARSASRTSLANVPATCVLDARIGYIQDVLVFETLRIIAEPMAGYVPPAGRHHSHVHLPHRLLTPHFQHVRQCVQHTSLECQRHRQKQMGLSIQESKLMAQSRSTNIQNYTIVRQDLCLGPGGGLLFFIFITQINFTRKLLSTTSKNDPHLEEVTISIDMDNTELLITSVYISRPAPAMGVIHHHSTTCWHRFTSAGRLQCSPFTLALQNNRNERQPTGVFNQHFQLCSPKRRFSHKDLWECRPQFSGCIVSISLSHHLVQMANTHDHELRPSAHSYSITDNCHIISRPAQNLHQP